MTLLIISAVVTAALGVWWLQRCEHEWSDAETHTLLNHYGNPCGKRILQKCTECGEWRKVDLK